MRCEQSDDCAKYQDARRQNTVLRMHPLVTHTAMPQRVWRERREVNDPRPGRDESEALATSV
jgi:hypothetical protein